MAWMIKTKHGASSKDCSFAWVNGECHYDIGFLEMWNKCSRWQCPLKRFSLSNNIYPYGQEDYRSRWYMVLQFLLE